MLSPSTTLPPFGESLQVQQQQHVMTVTPLGAGAEVGRSCIVLKFRGKTIMFDCGVHPAYTGMASLPFFDEINPAEVDLVLISQYSRTRPTTTPLYSHHLPIPLHPACIVSTWTMPPPCPTLWSGQTLGERF